MTHAVREMKSNLDSIAKKVEDSDVIGDLVEPMEQFTKVFKTDTHDCLTNADKIWSKY